jgi:sec-independent protein translocase protein TatB
VFNGLTFEKLLLVAIVAAFLLGPDKLPHYAAKLGQLVKTLRGYANGAKSRMKEEMGPEFDEVDWKKLDPRQYDPRRIIREALSEEDPVVQQTPAIVRPLQRPEPAYLAHKRTMAAAGATAVVAGGAVAAGASVLSDDGETAILWFDNEAT